MKKARIAIVLLFGFLCLLGILYAARNFGSNEQIYLQAKMLYGLAIGLVLIAASCIAYHSVRYLRTRVKLGVLALLYAALLSLLCCLLSPPSMRVQWDEANILSTSKGMFLTHADEYIFESLVDHGAISPLYKTQDKRPPLFPFLISIVHQIRGFSIANAFVVNICTLAIFLFSVFLFLYSYFGVWAALAGPLFVLSSPVVVICASSAGFDLLAACLLLLTQWSAFRYVKNVSFESLFLFVCLGLLLSYSRYESAACFIVISALVLWVTFHHWKEDLGSKILLLTLPIYLVPIAMLGLTAKQLLYFQQDMHLAGGEIFSWKYAIDHLQIFIRQFFRLDFSNPFCGPLNLLGLIAVGFAMYRKKLSRDSLLLMIGVLLQFAIALTFYYGDVRNFTAVRLFLPITMVATLSPFLLLQFSSAKYWPRLFLLIGLICFCAEIPILREGQKTFISGTSKAANALHMILPRSGADPQKSLFVFKQPSFLNMEGFASVDLANFIQFREQIRRHMQQSDITSIFFIDMDAPEIATPQREFLKNQKTKLLLDLHAEGIQLEIIHLLTLGE